MYSAYRNKIVGGRIVLACCAHIKTTSQSFLVAFFSDSFCRYTFILQSALHTSVKLLKCNTPLKCNILGYALRRAFQHAQIIKKLYVLTVAKNVHAFAGLRRAVKIVDSQAGMHASRSIYHSNSCRNRACICREIESSQSVACLGVLFPLGSNICYMYL